VAEACPGPSPLQVTRAWEICMWELRGYVFLRVRFSRFLGLESTRQLNELEAKAV